MNITNVGVYSLSSSAGHVKSGRFVLLRVPLPRHPPGSGIPLFLIECRKGGDASDLSLLYACPLFAACGVFCRVRYVFRVGRRTLSVLRRHRSPRFPDAFLRRFCYRFFGRP